MINIVEQWAGICVEMDEANHNKGWWCFLYDNDDVETRWGRIGASKLQSKKHPGAGKEKYASLIKGKQKERTGTKKDGTKYKFRYTLVDTIESGLSVTASGQPTGDLKSIATSQIQHNNPVVQKLIEYFTDVNAHNITAATGGKITFDTSSAQFTTPMGVISPAQVAEARIVLNELAPMVIKKQFGYKRFIERITNYLRLVPHDVGMKRIDPEAILPDMNAIQSEVDLLDGLETSFQQVTATPGSDEAKTTAPKVFDVQLHLVSDQGLIDNIRKLFQESKKSQHASSTYKVQTVYAVDIASMTSAFDTRGKKLSGRIHQLWHGTKSQNILSILKVGLIIPPYDSSFCAGRMFGNGLYFAPSSTKALQYSTGGIHHSGPMANSCFMFLADVAVGRVNTPDTNAGTFPRANSDTTWAKGGRTKSTWGSRLMNDEVIVYQTWQAKLSFMIEFAR